MTENQIIQTHLPTKQPSRLPKVAIVGRTNVGKSSLFNRILGKRRAIVLRERGTTRDRLAGDIKWKGLEFQLIDTGGFVFSKQADFAKEINREVDKAIEEAQLVLFVCDGKEGLIPQDELFADRLRVRNKQIVLVVNKLDQIEGFGEADQFYRLGFQYLVKISAAHGHGVPELLDLIVQKIPEAGDTGQARDCDFSLSIVGEPNSGKSTYFNALLQEERAIVSDIPGTTRDVIQELVEYRGQKILLRDTAGIRPVASSASPTLRFSIHRTKEAIHSSEVVIFLSDGYEGLGGVSKQIMNFVLDCKKACVIAINKLDKVKGFEQAKYVKLLHSRAPFLAPYPVVFISAKLQKNILKPLDEALHVYQKHLTTVKTHELNAFLARLKKSHPAHENVKLKFLTQIRNAPPHFLLIGRRVKELKEPTLQFIRNQIRERFELLGTPIQLTVREEKS